MHCSTTCQDGAHHRSAAAMTQSASIWETHQHACFDCPACQHAGYSQMSKFANLQPNSSGRALDTNCDTCKQHFNNARLQQKILLDTVHLLGLHCLPGVSSASTHVRGISYIVQALEAPGSRHRLLGSLLTLQSVKLK